MQDIPHPYVVEFATKLLAMLDYARNSLKWSDRIYAQRAWLEGDSITKLRSIACTILGREVRSGEQTSAGQVIPLPPWPIIAALALEASEHTSITVITDLKTAYDKAYSVQPRRRGTITEQREQVKRQRSSRESTEPLAPLTPEQQRLVAAR